MRNHNKSINSSKVTRLLISWHQNRICGFKKKKNCIRDTLFNLGHVLLFFLNVFFFFFRVCFAMLRRPCPARAPDSKSQRQEVRFEGCMWRSGSASSPAARQSAPPLQRCVQGRTKTRQKSHLRNPGCL